MIRKLFYITFCMSLFVCQFSMAQIICNKDSIQFNSINETQLDSVALIIKNTSEKSIEIKEFKFYKTYKSYPFFVKNFAKTTISAGDSISVFLYFKPSHNIFHNSEMLIVTNPSAYSKTIDLKAQGKYSLTYYANTENQSEENLKTILKAQLASGYVSLGYNVARDNMFMTIDNQKVNGQGASVNSLECIYTGKKSLAFGTRTESQNNDNFNTEHTFPQGYFSQGEPMRSDLHHLFPTNDAANNSRNNFAFGVATTPYVSESINTPSHLGSNGLYEPRDAQKGRTARAMMYFVLRYQDYTNFFAPQENILRTWHETFPPTNIDKKRNSDIALVQKNRNPFVDYPVFADRINKLIGISTSPVVNSLKWIDTITVQTIIDTAVFISIDIPFVNDGNTNMNLVDFSSLDTSVHFVNSDTLKIKTGESGSKRLQIYTNKRVGEFTSNVTFNSSIFQGANFILNYKIDSVSTGVQNNVNSKIKLYPNPTSDKLIVNFKQMSTYSIYNQLGENVSKGNINTGINTIDVANLNVGVYILKIENSYSYFIKN